MSFFLIFAFLFNFFHNEYISIVYKNMVEKLTGQSIILLDGAKFVSE